MFGWIVVFSPYTETLKQIALLRGGSIYIGDTGATKRTEYKDEFNQVAGSIMYVATKAGGVGINLTAGNRVIWLTHRGIRLMTIKQLHAAFAWDRLSLCSSTAS